MGTELARIAGRPLDSVSTGGVRDAASTLGRFTIWTGVTVDLPVTGPPRFSKDKRPAQSQARVGRDGTVMGPESTGLVHATRMMRLTEPTADGRRRLTRRAIRLAKEDGLSWEVLQRWAAESFLYVDPTIVASFIASIASPPQPMMMFSAPASFVSSVARKLGARVISGDHAIVSMDRWPEVEAHLVELGLIEPREEEVAPAKPAKSATRGATKAAPPSAAHAASRSPAAKAQAPKSRKPR